MAQAEESGSGSRIHGCQTGLETVPMSMHGDQLQRTPLYHSHVRIGASMTAFAGWEMPLKYSGMHDECMIVRNSAGIFDVSHMGQILVSGRNCLELLEYSSPGNIAGLEDGKMLYAVLCNEHGGTLDDLTVYRLSSKEYLLIVNAGRIQFDEAWLLELARKFSGVEIRNLSDGKGMLAVQGPQAEGLMSSLGGNHLRDLQYFGFCSVDIEGEEALVSRSGYTGEDGFELICESESLSKIWSSLRNYGAHPCGLGARDVLRTEMGYCLYGQELDQNKSPLEAGLSWTLKLDKEDDFIGKNALLIKKKERTYRSLVGFSMLERAIPRPGYTVCNCRGEEIGTVSSGTYSPSLEAGIGLAFVEPGFKKRGTALKIDMRGKLRRAKVVRLPFVASKVRK